ncbi:MAG: hypothetical protein Q4A18_00710 [Rikenellaceae bacterium]|nr:hypothetical protein [Rikenellaceae bacterium]
MLHDHDFYPEREEEARRQAEEELLARRIRREVVRVQSGEAEEDLAADREAEEAAEAERVELEERRERRRRNPIYRLFSGTILVGESAAKTYPYLLTIAAMFFLNIVVLFWSLHLDLRYSRLEREVQKLREKSIRLEELRYSRATHTAVSRELEKRGIVLQDPLRPGQIIE